MNAKQWYQHASYISYDDQALNVRNNQNVKPKKKKWLKNLNKIKKWSKTHKNKPKKGNKTATNSNNKHKDEFIIRHSQRQRRIECQLDVKNLEQRTLSICERHWSLSKLDAMSLVLLISAICILPARSKWIYEPSKYMDDIKGSFISELTMFADVSATKQFLDMLRWKDSQGLIYWMLDDHDALSEEEEGDEKGEECGSSINPLINPFWSHLSKELSTLYDPVTRSKYNGLHLDETYYETSDDERKKTQ
eukprot:TRINITY_DN25657_c0_g1_i1.p1 TRINITY_DN25657_c0_g1~~TRINITY_DN25657_c0_g1_i1.p1  ORF type:complete len:249 (+),score=35.59 TRINITY_DN25657_c0_g1_i1:19-765(+)